MRTAILRHVSLLSLVVACTRGETRADSATSAQTATPLSNWTADSAAIVAALDSSRAGWNRADLDAHYGIYDDSVAFVFKGSANDPPIRTLSNVRGMAAEPFQAKANPPISEEMLLIKPLGRDVAVSVVRGTMKLKDRELTTLMTRVWQRTPAGWRVVADHAS
jgi:hypothetical protein